MLSHQDSTPLHLAAWFPDVTASVFFEVPAVAAADVSDITSSSHMRMRQPLIMHGGALFIISVGNPPL